ncbi:MAG: MFS transporter [Candidatus Heimdallarchaeota archaeon]
MRTTHMVQIGLYHLLFGIAVVALDGFVPARHEVLGISALWTGIVIGGYNLAEISRIPFGLVSDSKLLFSRRRTSYIVVGNLVATLGFLTIPLVVASPLLLISVVIFALGLSLAGPAADALLIDLSTKDERPKAASALHSLRILGFALGGMMGTVLHRLRGFNFIFYAIAGVMLVLTFLSVYHVPDSRKKIEEIPFIPNNQLLAIPQGAKLKENLVRREVLLMALFLFVFQIGLFMQNAILERYGVRELHMPEEQAGTLNAAWAMGTLLAIIFTGFFLIKRLGKMASAYIGIIVAVIGLFLVSIVETLSQLYIATFVFGIGSGIGSVPPISLMMDICEVGGTAATMIAFYGLIDALGKGMAAFLGGGSGQILGYRPVFHIEILVFLIALFLLRLTWVEHMKTNPPSSEVNAVRRS